MADQHKKIHPLNNQNDVESATDQHHPPSAPLVPRGSSKSDHGDSAAAAAATPHPPPHFRRHRGCTCCRCLCWTLSTLLLLTLAVAATIGILYLVFRPKLPDYSIDRLEITRLNLTNSNTLAATFDVTITARNSNKKIGIYYEGGSRIGVLFGGNELCLGAMPKFYQGHRNTTVLRLELAGESRDAAGLFGEMQREQEGNGFVPLDLRVRQPVRIKLGRLKLMKVKFVVRCRLNVDSLAANNDIRIRDSRCKFRLRL